MPAHCRRRKHCFASGDPGFSNISALGRLSRLVHALLCLRQEERRLGRVEAEPASVVALPDVENSGKAVANRLGIRDSNAPIRAFPSAASNATQRHPEGHGLQLNVTEDASYAVGYSAGHPTKTGCPA